ncbi:hypothetical protein DXG01_008160 [Tephrocybe rancida]|nr:hypothetical protein DXG01_008160 [Tephrocybe rancida]
MAKSNNPVNCASKTPAKGKAAEPSGSCKHPASQSCGPSKTSKKAKGSRSTCKAPAAIHSASESEEETVAATTTRKGKSRAVAPISGSDSDHNGEYEDEGEGEKGECSEDEWEMLNPETLSSERPHWAGDNDDAENEHPAPSKRALDRQAEVPTWNDDSSDAPEVINAPQAAATNGLATAPAMNGNGLAPAAPTMNGNGLAITATAPGANGTTAAAIAATPIQAISDYDVINSQWPPDAHYVPPAAGSRSIALMAQPRFMRALIKAGIYQVTTNLLFVDAFPSVTTINDYYRVVLVDKAAALDIESLVDRINNDSVLLDHISCLFTTHLSNVCCNVKKTTLPKIETSFNITGTVVERCEIVKALLSSGDYIYFRKAGGLIVRTRPYFHNIIILAIRELFFSGAWGSLASKHASRFTSSMDIEPFSKELELPLAMVYASLDDWNSSFLKKSKFNADAYEDIYHGHELFLNNIWNDRSCADHRLMADMYNEMSSNSQGGHPAQAVANNAMAILDLAAMEE